MDSSSIDGSAPAEPLSSSPHSSNSSNGSSSHGKADDPFALSSDPADHSSLRHPKGKRKRTAAKDKAILEAAYLANPKPDKSARLDIVSQVSLNEKEVQIWFQNRRQNDRRKSRPLSAQEIVALRYGGMHALSYDPSPPFLHSLSQHSSFSDGTTAAAAASSSSPPHQHLHASFSAANPPSTTPLSSPELGPWTPEALARKRDQNQQQQQQQQQQHASFGRGRDAAAEAEAAGRTTQTPSLVHSFSSSVGSVGYLANRWNMQSSFSTPSSLSGGDGISANSRDDSVQLEPFAPSSSAPPVLPSLSSEQQQQQQQQQQHQPPQRPTHHRPFRLSLSLKGKAEIISSQSPSPPRLPPPKPTGAVDRRSHSSSSTENDSPLPALPAIRRAGLNRSQSAFSSLGLTLPPISNLTNSLANGSAPAPAEAAAPPLPFHPPRLLRGRSRDVHIWESVCDADTRVDDELSAQAQHEASGSAIAAISLLRSASSTAVAAAMLSPASASASTSTVLQPNGTKRNASSRSVVPKPGAKRAKLGRAASSLARMQSAPYPRGDVRTGVGEKDKAWVDDEKRKKLKLSTLLSGNDSDKENWSPDEYGRPAAQTPARLGGGGSGGGGTGTGRRPLPSSRTAPLGRAEGAEGKSHPRNALQGASRRQTSGALSSADELDVYEDDDTSPPPPPLSSSSKRLLGQPRGTVVPAADEVEKFMRGGVVSPSKKGDFDCVAGLLSLSQGNWR